MPLPDEPDENARLLILLSSDLDVGFVSVVRTYERTIYSVAVRVAGSGGGDAEDLTSECFLKAFVALRDYPPERMQTLQLRAWLLTILLNLWRNSLRTASRRVSEVVMAELPDARHSQVGVEEQVLQGEASRELTLLLGKLPPPQRSAVVLRHAVGLSISEISHVLRCPEGTAKSHVSRGMTTLRTLYAKESGTIAEPAMAMESGRPGAARRFAAQSDRRHPAAEEAEEEVAG